MKEEINLKGLIHLGPGTSEPVCKACDETICRHRAYNTSLGFVIICPVDADQEFKSSPANIPNEAR